jgi:putative phosphoesterase
MITGKTTRIGVIADTHGLFDPAIIKHFKGVVRIIHAGDIGDPVVIEQLERIAPVTAVSGNVDDYERSGFPSEAVIELAGRRVAIRHILYQGGKLTTEGRAFLERERPDICIFGHTHQQKVERFGLTRLINPGSAGPKRFTLPRGIAILRLTKTRVSSALIRLRDKAERGQPGQKKPLKKIHELRYNPTGLGRSHARILTNN